MISFLIVAFFVFLSMLLVDLWRRSKFLDMPAKFPGSLPLIGHAHLLVGDGKYLWNLVQDVQKHCLKNEGISYLKIGPEIHYMICDPHDYSIVMENCLEKNYWYQKILGSWVGEGLVTASVPTWKRHQKLLYPSFSQGVVNGFLDIHNNQARKLVTRLSGLTEPIHPMEYIRQAALEANFQAAFGLQLDEETVNQMEKYIKAFVEILQIMTKRIQNILMHSDCLYSITVLKKRQDAALKITKGLTEEIIKKKRMARGENKSDHSGSGILQGKRLQGFMDLILELSDEGLLTDDEVRMQVDTMILAGYETTSTTAAYVCIMLGSYPEVQEKVYQELQEVFGGSDRDVDKQDLSKLVYLDAVLKEVGRLYPAAPVVTRHVDKDLRLKNFLMPAGTNCAILLSGVNRHSIWGPDSNQFRPERWLDQEKLPKNAAAYAGFSTGKRACIGRPYAVNFMKVTLAHLLRNFKIQADHSKMLMELQLFLKPAEGCLVTLEPRI